MVRSSKPIRDFLDRVARALDNAPDPRSDIAALLEALKPEDFDLGARLPLSSREPIRQEEIFSSDGFSVGLFLIATGQKLPLHDHPRMTVWLKVLRGTLRVRSYDWVEKEPRGGWVQLTSDLHVDPETEPQILRADHGNLHEIRAVEDAAFLDLFSPYYSPDRPCSYYRPRPGATTNDGQRLWLDKVPEDLAWGL